MQQTENRLILSTLNKDEARAFIKFLKHDSYLHLKNVRENEECIREIKTRFGVKE